jgi:site-specific DNA-methyltransferase (adenine-specific)
VRERETVSAAETRTGNGPRCDHQLFENSGRCISGGDSCGGFQHGAAERPRFISPLLPSLECADDVYQNPPGALPIESLTSETFTYRNSKLYQGDCLEWLRLQDRRSIHAVVTDPPYGLV